MERIIILDFGSQTTQLIARRVRELGEYCEILPYNKFPSDASDVVGVIFSGSPFSVNGKDSFKIDVKPIIDRFPVLGICYGAQLMAQQLGGTVGKHGAGGEYGRARIKIKKNEGILKGVSDGSQVWMSHGDTILSLPSDAELIASSEEVEVAAYRLKGRRVWGVQFHPEVHHSECGTQILSNFLGECGAERKWTSESFIDQTVARLREEIGDGKVIQALSGGVDSTVSAVLINKAVGKNLTCVFVDHGLMRENEGDEVTEAYKSLGLNVIRVNAEDLFLSDLAGKTDPEAKRKSIGANFIKVFEEEARKLKDISFLAQGTIYPDVIESLSISGTVIKSHHNVGGLPERMNLKLVEPLRLLFKDEVRRVGLALGIPASFISRHPFPGPGLGIRVLGEVTKEKCDILRKADKIYIDALREDGLYDSIWQAGTILLPVKSVGVMGDERTYDYTVALRAVCSTDAMTADWAHLPYEFLAKVSNEIINKVKFVNRVVYDISSKPPATIEWE